MRSTFDWRSAARFLMIVTSCTFFVSCSSGTTPSTPSLSEGIELPSEISAVSVREDSGAAVRIGRVKGSATVALLNYRDSVLGAVADLDDDADYNTVQIRKFVDIKALDVFDIISTIFDAMRQTHYTEDDNIGVGFYKCLVSFKDNGGDGNSNQTELQEWYVSSEFTTIDGEPGHRVTAMIIENDEGREQLITVQVDATEAPTENEDGTLADLGVWEIRATFFPIEDDVVAEETEGFFHATASVDEEGTPVLTISDLFTDEGPMGEIQSSTRAIIYRSQDEGYGVVEVPDWEACFGGPEGPPEEGICDEGPPLREVKFAYNETYLSVQVGEEDVVSFDRTDEHEIVYRYKLFNGDDGSDFEKTTSFGFPVTYENEEEDRFFGWYGAWQDRHELWLGGDQAEDGAEVERDNFGDPEATPTTYTVDRFDGALQSIQLVEGSVDQLEGIAAEVFLFNDFRLIWNDEGGNWDHCSGFNEEGGCGESEDFTDQLDSLASVGDGDQRQIFINGCLGGGEEVEPTCGEFVYVADGEAPGFYAAMFNEETGQLEAGEEILDEGTLNDGDELWVGVSGRTYVEYTGEFDGETTSSGWVEKTLTDFNFETWQPEFDDEGDREFFFDEGREYFINNRGANLRVRREASDGAASDYGVYMEAVTVAKPNDDLDTVYPDGTILEEPWDPDNASTYELETDPESDNYLLLVYASVSENDESDGISVGDVVTSDLWGLRIQGDDSEFEDQTLFNWEYQDEGDGWGSVAYLVDEEDNHVLVSEPIRFDPIALARTDDLVNENPEEDWLTYSLMFDGFLHGLPDTSYELQKINFEGDQIPAVLANNVRIPDGTELTDQDDNTYYVRGVDVGIFLGFVTDFPGPGGEPDISQADDVDLDTDIPEFVDPETDTTIPTDVDLLYVEGIPVASE